MAWVDRVNSDGDGAGRHWLQRHSIEGAQSMLYTQCVVLFEIRNWKVGRRF